MNDRVFLEIVNAENSIDTIRKLNVKFLEFAREHSTPERLPTKLEVTDEGITVHCFGHNAEAKHRVVRTGDGEFLIEYVFLVAQDEDRHEVFRFYLTTDGGLYESLEPSSRICDFNNQYLAKHICFRILSSVLKSSIFAPLPKTGH